MKEKFDIYKEAVKQYGIDAQEDMLLEEMSEVQKAILKHRRAVKYGQTKDKPISYFINNIIEELADVTLMINQLLTVYDHDGKFNEYYDQKIARITEKLNETETKIHCPNCNSLRYYEYGGRFTRQNEGLFVAMKCKDCGKIGRVMLL